MPDCNNQTWLILSHAFNMDGRAASQTITDKIPHLIKLGVKPVIISGILGRKDKKLEHHQIVSALPVGMKFDLRHYLKNRISSRLIYRIIMLALTILLSPLYLLEKFLMPIETTWSWSISAYLTGRRIIAKQRPNLIYSTGGAYSAHLAGYWLSRHYNIPWIAEIHDPMVYEGQPITKARRKFLLWLEKIICTHADVVWWFTRTAMDRARQRNPQLGDRGHWVIAGVDAPDFEKVAYQRSKQLLIGHFGSLSATRNLEEFLTALDIFISTDRKRAETVRFYIYGGSMDAISAKAIEKFPYSCVIENRGRLENNPITGESGRLRVLKRMNEMDCLLLLHGTDAFCQEYIPSKYFEYLWTQRPVLGLVHSNSQLTDMLKEFNHWPAQNSAEITQVLEELYRRWQCDELKDRNTASPYTTSNAVQKIYRWVNHMHTEL